MYWNLMKTIIEGIIGRDELFMQFYCAIQVELIDTLGGKIYFITESWWQDLF